MLDIKVCSRARLSRDPRFDGKFYIGVFSTRIYCRPICPVPTVKEENVRYFPTAPSAAEAGYRPCLRCRPECSPGTPAWSGTSATVSRALRLIDESGLEEGGIEGLADRLGVTSRHLRRLFMRHLGASPSSVERTRRLHFAKRLIDETRLPMADVAIASGYGCVRRFNAAIRSTYKRTPTHIRRLRQQKVSLPEDHYRFELPFRPPYDWNGMLAFLAARAVPGVESVDERTYRRSISLNGSHGYFEAWRDEGRDALSIRVKVPETRSLYAVIERIRSMFDLNADCVEIAQSLTKDPELASRIAAGPGLRVPGCWSAFELTIQAILGQLMTVQAGVRLASRVAHALGRRVDDLENLTHVFPTPEVLADAKLTDIGMTDRRAQTIRELSRRVCDGRVSFDRVADLDLFIAQLREIPGLSSWTAQYIAMRAFGDPDAFPDSDRGLLAALGAKNPAEAKIRADVWRPWRAYASMYLWTKPKK